MCGNAHLLAVQMDVVMPPAPFKVCFTQCGDKQAVRSKGDLTKRHRHLKSSESDTIELESRLDERYSLIGTVIMLRELYSSAILAPLAITIFVVLAQLADTEVAQQQTHDQTQQLHPSLLVDTKYWTRNTGFGEQDNWYGDAKPCTLLERIKIGEQLAVSMGDSLDSIKSNIKELTLAMDGLLLLEEDTLSDSFDTMLISFLDSNHDCHDSETIRSEHLGNGYAEFEFHPKSDHMSWFNPQNWASALNDPEIEEWQPESHQIPCSEDVVVFGSRHVSAGVTLEGEERGEVLTFKVNFRPSQAEEKPMNDSFVHGIRVAKLKIGDTSYNQAEFEQLISSNKYDNILFQFNDSLGVLKPEDGFAYPAHSLINIDESSIQMDQTHDLCLDEAGCLCGNEATNVMKLICSFSEPLLDSEQPCFDPLPSAGYCNRICATVITITMDPSKFSEKWLANTMTQMVAGYDVSDLLGDVFAASRRTFDNKYEITFRYVPSNGASLSHYETGLGREREIAKLLHEKLDRDAAKSFYGIKSISMKSSIEWRRNSQTEIFWISFFALSMAVASLELYNNHRLGLDNWSTFDRYIVQLRGWLNSISNRFATVQESLGESESFVRYSEPLIIEDSSQNNDSLTVIPLIELDNQETSDSNKSSRGQVD